MGYYIYCDESCHLKDIQKQSHMVIGGVLCDKINRKHISNLIKGLKKKHQLPNNYEIKWNKVSSKNIGFYTELIELIRPYNLIYRAVVVDKGILNHNRFNQSEDDFYYKMYYTMLKFLVSQGGEKFTVYLDRKDTNGYTKVKTLEKYLLNKYYNLVDIDIVEQISHEHQLMQLADLLIGATSYKNRMATNTDLTSTVKRTIVEMIEKEYSTNLSKSSSYNSKYINILVWRPKNV